MQGVCLIRTHKQQKMKTVTNHETQVTNMVDEDPKKVLSTPDFPTSRERYFYDSFSDMLGGHQRSFFDALCPTKIKQYKKGRHVNHVSSVNSGVF